MKNSLIFSLSIFISIIFFSCNNNDLTESQNDFSLGGNIVLMTEYAAPISDRSGVKVYIEGTNYETLTDQLGNWKIYNVPAGVHNIIAKKEGFGYNKIINFNYLGNADSNNFGQTLIASPTYSIGTIDLDISTQDLILTIHPSIIANNLRIALIYAGKQEPVYDSIETWDYLRQTQIYPSNSSITETFPNGFFINEGFNHGDTLYFAIYPGSSIVAKYFLPPSSRYIYTSGVGSTPKRFIYIIP